MSGSTRLYLQQGLLDQARQSLEQDDVPDVEKFPLWLDLGNAYASRQQFLPASQCFNLASNLQPENLDAAFFHAESLRFATQFQAAQTAFEKVLLMEPSNVRTLRSLAELLTNRGDHARALELYKKLESLGERSVDVLGNIAFNSKATGELSQAEDYAKAVLKVAENAPPALNILASSLVSQGRANEAIDYYRKLLKLQPQNRVVRSNYLLSLHYLEGSEHDNLLEEHRQWQQHSTQELAGIEPYHATKGARTRFRVAFISSDFRQHAVSYFVEPLFKHVPTAKFEVICIQVGGHSDSRTDALRHSVEQWLELPQTGVQEQLRWLRGLDLDVAIDLNGHAGINLLPHFSARFAQHQATYLGYPDGTGLTNMDYRISDAATESEETADSYSEKLILLEHCFLCYSNPADDLDLPAGRDPGNPAFTYGCFNNMAKVTPVMIDAWVAILRQSMATRLLLKNHSLADTRLRERFLKRFEQAGIDTRSRVSLLPPTGSFAEHLDAYRQVDLALDTFPYNGTTTTCEALSMGVPVLSLSGARHHSRVSGSLIGAAGPEAGEVVRHRDEYVGYAVHCATQGLHDGVARRALREQVKGAALTDSGAFAGRYFAALSQLLADGGS